MVLANGSNGRGPGLFLVGRVTVCGLGALLFTVDAHIGAAWLADVTVVYTHVSRRYWLTKDSQHLALIGTEKDLVCWT